MKRFSPRVSRLCGALLASALLGAGLPAQAAVSFQSSADPVFVGSSFFLVWSDDAVNPATGYSSFDVLVNFDPATLGAPTARAGSAFGDATLGLSYDVFDATGERGSDGSGDPGWALLHILRNAGAQPATFGTDILRLDFTVLGPLGGGAVDVTFFPDAPGSAPRLGEYQFPTGTDSFTAEVGVLALPEPAPMALMLAGLGVLWTKRPGRRRSQPAAPLAAA